MKKLIQTRLYVGPAEEETIRQRGNCFPTVIACMMGKDSAEDVIQIQEYYDMPDDGWISVLYEWLFEQGYEWDNIGNHLYDDSYYLVTGRTERGTIHICIYQNGKLYHDPHPDGAGLTDILSFCTITKIPNEV